MKLSFTTVCVLSALGFVSTGASAAVYELVDLGYVDAARDTHGIDGNSSGTIAVAGTSKFVAEPDDDSMPVGDSIAYISDGNSFNRLQIFDTEDSGTTEEFVYVVDDYSNVGGYATGPYRAVDYTKDDGTEVTRWVRDLGERGYIWQNGTIHEVVPPFAEYGGYSMVRDIDYVEGEINASVAVGSASTAYTSATETLVEETCPDADELFEYCIRSRIYQLNAYKWVLNSDGSIASAEDLGLLVEPAEDTTRQYISQANAINNQGVAVGWSDTHYKGDADYRRRYAAIFKDGTVTAINDNEDTYVSTIASDISNPDADGNVYVVGYAWVEADDEQWRNKFFYTNLSEAEPRMHTAYLSSGVNDFYRSANSYARAVNSQGLVVGRAEFEFKPSNLPRQYHGFVYDISNQTFTDLNTLVSCDNQDKYEIVDARHIDEDGNIIASALITGPARDEETGELIEGETENVVQSVILKYDPAGTIDECPVEADEPNKRKGLPFSPLLLLVAGFAVILRTRKRTVTSM